MARIMAVDYGKKRTGLAVTDSFQIIASALDTVETPVLKEYLTHYFQKEEVECVVIGEPTHKDGTATYLEEDIKTFIDWLKISFPTIKIARHDETGTSADAKSILLRSGAKKKKRRDKSLLDKISATIILQEYLGF